jgi:hypothetical protein
MLHDETPSLQHKPQLIHSHTPLPLLLKASTPGSFKPSLKKKKNNIFLASFLPSGAPTLPQCPLFILLPSPPYGCLFFGVFTTEKFKNF